MNVSEYWIINKQNTNIKSNCDTFINKMIIKRPKLLNTPVSFLGGVLSVIAKFTDSTPPRKDTGVFKSFGRFIIILLDESVTITLYICVLYIHICIYAWWVCNAGYK